MRSVILILFLAGCGDTGQSLVSFGAVGRGAPATIASDGWTVTLDVARLGLGPVYFCATQAASESLCQIAVAELPRTFEIDALSPAEQPLGDGRGTTGTIQSAMYDLGITWFATQPEARAATTIGHSAHFEGRAERGGVTRRFIADVDVRPQYQGAVAVNGARLPAPRSIDAATSRVRISVDAAAWIAGVVWNELDTLPGDPAVFPPSSPAVGYLANALINFGPMFEWF
jgi:hypothetical protein